MSEISGKATRDGGWAVPQDARLVCAPQGVRIAVGGTTVEASWDDVRLRPSLLDAASVFLDVRTPDGQMWRFEGPARPILESVRNIGKKAALLSQANEIEGKNAAARRSLGSRMGAVVSVFGVLIGLFLIGVHYLPDYVADHVPLSWEETLGQTTQADLQREGRIITSGAAYDAIHTVWDRLAKGLTPSPYTFRITVVDSPVVNAFAAPGGYVAVYTGLLKELDSPEALAGILGHEAQHVIHKHTVKSMIRSLQWEVAFGLVWAVTRHSREADSISTFREMAGEMDSLAYSRDHESEADHESVRALVRAHIDPLPFARFFRKLAEKEDPHIVLLSTHPGSNDRADVLEAFATTLEPYTTEPIRVDWKAVQQSLEKAPQKSP